MSRQRTYALSLVSAIAYFVLLWLLTDESFAIRGGALWGGAAIAASTIWTYFFIILILGAGVIQPRALPASGIQLRPHLADSTPGQREDPIFWTLLMGNSYWAIVWLPIRFYMGREWLISGEGKIRGGTWKSGEALKGFWTGAVAVVGHAVGARHAL